MTPNPHLGDVQIELILANGNKVAFVMRPTPRATMEVEQAFGIGLPSIAMALAAGQVRTERLADIILAGARAAGHTGGSVTDLQGNRADFDMQPDKLYDAVFYTGRWKIQEACYKLVDAMLNGGIASDVLKKSSASESETTPTLSLGGTGSDSLSVNSAGANPNSGTAPGGPSSPPSSG